MELNKIVQETMKNLREIEEKLFLDTRTSLILMNSNADCSDKNRNRVNYGAAIANAGILNFMGYKTEIFAYEEDGFLKADKFECNGNEIKL